MNFQTIDGLIHKAHSVSETFASMWTGEKSEHPVIKTFCGVPATGNRTSLPTNCSNCR